jgi:hypothetical protein
VQFIPYDAFVDQHFGGSDTIRSVCHAASDEAPALIFVWRNVDVFVQSIPQVASTIAPPFALPANPTVDQFKDALLNYVRTPTTTTMERAVLLCDICGLGQASGNMAVAAFHPWFIAVAAQNPHATPIASVWVPERDRQAVAMALMPSPDSKCPLWG